MVIANPIYDVVFKRMMENDRAAKFFISTLLEQTVETVTVKPQEFTYTDELAGLSVFRLDFIAEIRTAEGGLKKILIEIQKARNEIDLMRFRNYLGEQYKKESLINNKKMVLPITTIYILGFNLPEITTPCLKVERSYKDLVNKKTLDFKSDFIENLTHDSYIVQVERITGRYQTRLDKLLSIFEQNYFIDDTRTVKQYNHPTDIEEVKIITAILHHTGTDPEEKKKIEIEQEAWRTVEAMWEERSEKMRVELEDKNATISEIKADLEEKEKALSEKEMALSEKDKLIEELQRKLSGS